MTNMIEVLKVPAVNGTVLAVTIWSEIQVMLSCILLKALRDFHREE